jgi:hypothetical protein
MISHIKIPDKGSVTEFKCAIRLRTRHQADRRETIRLAISASSRRLERLAVSGRSVTWAVTAELTVAVTPRTRPLPVDGNCVGGEK